ncbi:uncharacterized protein LOC131944159 [Physella acuta]|uniref:uncharacterized protein LOC131944159 n=1 Tax=Physella acuta TaxID=109671 RepID=UPI0027DB34AE|nr:uncharacterized protein LOC131944159 [Physella acuta]
MDVLVKIFKGRSFTLIVITAFTLSKVAVADRTQLLERLKDKTWPWFGDCYKNLCPDFRVNPTFCLNFRPVPESILQRAGLPESLDLTTDLEVIFSSPKEAVDVCGKAQMMDEVKAFKLPDNGHPVQSLLERGAEIYRSRPKVNWSPKENGTYSLIIYDVGHLVVKGIWHDIQYTNGRFEGQTDFLYRPPANPLPVVNPTLIILLKQTELLGPYSSIGLESCTVSKNGPICRESVESLIGDGKGVVGLQVFYTNGSSMFEKYNVCIDGYICDTQCIGKFREYAAHKVSNIQFMNLDVSTIDTYVNVRFQTKIPGSLTMECCSRSQHYATYGFVRARPGDDFKVSSYDRLCGSFQCHSSKETEMSSTERNILGDSDYCTFYVFVPHIKDGVLEAKFTYWMKNSKINSGSEETEFKEQLYDSKGKGTRHMYMLLFTHPNVYRDTPTVSADNKIVFPGDFKLRGMSWILFDHDYYTFTDEKCDDTTRTCPPNEPNHPSGQNKRIITFNETQYETPAESSTKQVISCLQRKPPPPPNNPPPNKSVRNQQEMHVLICVCFSFYLF